MPKMNNFLLSLVFINLFAFGLPASGLNLPISAEADRLILAAESAIESKDRHEAKKLLSQAKALDTKLPNQFYFLYGLTLFHLDELDDASINLIKFIEAAERGSSDYKKALNLLTSIEKRNSQHQGISNKTNTAQKKQTSSLIENADAQFIKQLQQLYLTNSPSAALLKHINEMLTSYALKRPEKIIKQGQRPSTRYRLSRDHTGNLITSSQTIDLHEKTDSKSVINTSKIYIYGVDPFVTYRCSIGTNSCWLRSPANGEQWIEISHNEQAASDIARACTALIKVLQKGEM